MEAIFVMSEDATNFVDMSNVLSTDAAASDLGQIDKRWYSCSESLETHPVMWHTETINKSTTDL